MMLSKRGKLFASRLEEDTNKMYLRPITKGMTFCFQSPQSSIALKITSHKFFSENLAFQYTFTLFVELALIFAGTRTKTSFPTKSLGTIT